jgi:hypothetical protein
MRCTEYPQRLEGIIITVGEAAIDEPLRDVRPLAGAEICRLENGAQYALGRDRISPDVFPVAHEHNIATMDCPSLC